jgi:hypothetical protein
VTSSRPEIAPQPILLFAAHALVLALLLGYWPTPREFFPQLFRAQANALYGGDGTVALRAVSPGSGDAGRTVMESFEAGGRERRWAAHLDAVRLGYWPAAVLLALFFATPLTASRRGIGCVLGFLWIQAFALGRLGVEILRAEAEVQSGAAGAPASADIGGQLLFLRTSSEVLNSNIVTIAAVLLAWVTIAVPSRSLVLGGLARVLGPAAGLSARSGSRPAS